MQTATIAALTVTMAGCSASNLLTRLSIAPSPHDTYADGLRGANLGDTALGRDWLTAGEQALKQPLSVTLPLNETGYFAADAPRAVAYRFELERGRRLNVDVAFDGLEFPRLFVDLFEVRETAAPERVASLTEGLTLAFDAPRDGAYVLRIQPELLRSGRFTVVQRTVASLPFPVAGLTAAAVQSEFGAARDAGRRQHEGIDIFAPRGVAVLAVVAGTAQTGTNALGGNVVWLQGRGFGESFYYAHLDRWAFEGTTRVNTGDVLGYVGNTGNARTTSPHLHFGIYDRGAIDPLPFLRADDAVPPPPANAADLPELVRVGSARASLRSGPARTADAIVQLERGSLALALGASGTLLRVELPDRTIGYLDRAAVVTARKPLRQQPLPAGTVVRDRPVAAAPSVLTIDAPITAGVVGEFDRYALIELPTGIRGWIPARPSSADSR